MAFSKKEIFPSMARKYKHAKGIPPNKGIPAKHAKSGEGSYEPRIAPNDRRR